MDDPHARIVRIALLILIAALATILGGHYLLRLELSRDAFLMIMNMYRTRWRCGKRKAKPVWLPYPAAGRTRSPGTLYPCVWVPVRAAPFGR